MAGKQKGKEDDRYLWPEMLRVIQEIKPTWVLGENVPGIINIAGKAVCEDLEREGYAVTIFNFEAAAVGARHRRDRVFFVGHTKQTIEFKGTGISGSYDVVADTKSVLLQGQHNGQREKQFGRSGWWATEPGLGGVVDGLSHWLDDYWRIEPDIPRVATGVQNRVDRLKCLGNAVVPQQVYPILKAIAEIESGYERR